MREERCSKKSVERKSAGVLKENKYRRIGKKGGRRTDKFKKNTLQGKYCKGKSGVEEEGKAGQGSGAAKIRGRRWE